MNALIAVRCVRATINNGTLSWRSTYATQSKVQNQQKKGTSGSGSSQSTNTPPTSSKNIDPPTNVFKKVDSKVIGPGAGKETNYKNPEYFCYHEMSYADMEIHMAKLRLPQPSSIKR